jgi:hypothetical protein
MESLVIERFGIPTKMDELPYGTQCKVIDHHHDIYSLYVQVSKESEPNWEFIGMFCSATSKDFINNILKERLIIE